MSETGAGNGPAGPLAGLGGRPRHNTASVPPRHLWSDRASLQGPGDGGVCPSGRHGTCGQLCRQALTALRPPMPDDGTTCAGAHAMAKPVLALPATDVRLKGALHGLTSPSFCGVAAPRKGATQWVAVGVVGRRRRDRRLRRAFSVKLGMARSASGPGRIRGTPMTASANYEVTRGAQCTDVPSVVSKRCG
jgi:hypothetical protein